MLTSSSSNSSSPTRFHRGHCSRIWSFAGLRPHFLRQKRTVGLTNSWCKFLPISVIAAPRIAPKISPPNPPVAVGEVCCMCCVAAQFTFLWFFFFLAKVLVSGVHKEKIKSHSPASERKTLPNKQKAPMSRFLPREFYFYQWLENVYDRWSGDEDPLNSDLLKKECVLNCVLSLTDQYIQQHPKPFELWTNEEMKAPALVALWIADKQFGLSESLGIISAEDLASECNCSAKELAALEREILEANDYVVCGGLQGCTRAEEFMRPAWAPPLRTRRATVGERAELEPQQKIFMSPNRRHPRPTL